MGGTGGLPTSVGAPCPLDAGDTMTSARVPLAACPPATYGGSSTHLLAPRTAGILACLRLPIRVRPLPGAAVPEGRIENGPAIHRGCRVNTRTRQRLRENVALHCA